MKRSLQIIIKKELKRVFTDKRLVVSIFVLPIVSMVVMYSIIGFVAASFIEDVKEHESRVVINNAPRSFKAYEQSEATHKLMIEYIENGSISDYKQRILDGDLDLFVTFQPDFEDALTLYKSGDIPSITTYYNYGEEYSAEAYKQLTRDVLPGYKSTILEDRFGDLSVVEVYTVKDESEKENVVNKEKATGKMASTILPMIISIFLFAGAMGIVMESVAGEKERGTLATLLILPVKREIIAMGKIISLSIVSLLSALSSVVGIVITFLVLGLLFPGGNGLSQVFELNYGPVHILQIFIAMMCMVAIYVSLIILLSSLAKTVKEAGTYITPIYMVVMVLSFMNMYAFHTEPMWKYAIPAYGQVLALKEILMYQITWAKLGVSVISAGIFTAILIYIIRGIFNNEKIIFTE